MNDPHNHEVWHQYEDGTEGPKAEYADYDEQASLSPADEAEHAEFVRRVAAEFEFPLSTWTPAIPVKH
jgi:hypothetical protein